jgi:Arc/MetJ-type ribon-helix-helix transcriptional regulator
MTTDLSAENEQYVAAIIARGDFHSRSEVLSKGIEFLRRRDEFAAAVEAGSRQLPSGEYRDYDREGLRGLFDRIKAEGRRHASEQARP